MERWKTPGIHPHLENNTDTLKHQRILGTAVQVCNKHPGRLLHILLRLMLNQEQDWPESERGSPHC